MASFLAVLFRWPKFVFLFLKALSDLTFYSAYFDWQSLSVFSGSVRPENKDQKINFTESRLTIILADILNQDFIFAHVNKIEIFRKKLVNQKAEFFINSLTSVVC